MAEEKKKKGFLSRFGFKSKDDKLAEAAAEKAEQQQLVDEQMAARMAAINAAALKSAREQDEQASGISVDDAETARIEAEEKRKAEEQAKKDVEAAKRLVQEKAEAAAEAKRKAEEEARRLAKEKLAREAEEKRLAEEKALKEAEEKTAEIAREKAEAEARKQAEIDAKAKAAEDARARKEAEAAAKAKAAEDARLYKEAETKRLAEEKAAIEKAAREENEQAAAALKVKQEAEAVERAEAEAKRQAEDALAEQARIEEAARKAKADQEQARLDQIEREAKEASERAEAEQRRAEHDSAEAEAQAKSLADRAALEKAQAEQAETARIAAARLEVERIEAQRLATQSEAAAEKAAQAARLAAESVPAEKPAEAPAKDGFFSRITQGLKKSTSRMSDNVSAIFTKRKLDAEALEELEDLLIASDLGVGPAMKVTELLAKDKFDKQVTDLEVKIALADVISEILTPLEKPIILTDTKPQILLFVGVNGSGKTTTLGKIAKRYHDQGKKVLIAAGDTFRAAAVEQLSIWGERAGAPVISGKLGTDAAGLVFDAITKAKSENFDILMIDTAGRLQNRTELMDELSKIVRVIKKQDATAPHHSILVLDATVGQNALTQTEAFKETAGVTGLIMTKLDGTAKGGVLVALSDKFKLPIHAIGIGERIEDLENFSAPVFAAALSGVADQMMDAAE